MLAAQRQRDFPSFVYPPVKAVNRYDESLQITSTIQAHGLPGEDVSSFTIELWAKFIGSVPSSNFYFLSECAIAAGC